MRSGAVRFGTAMGSAGGQSGSEMTDPRGGTPPLPNRRPSRRDASTRRPAARAKSVLERGLWRFPRSRQRLVAGLVPGTNKIGRGTP